MPDEISAEDYGSTDPKLQEDCLSPAYAAQAEAYNPPNIGSGSLERGNIRKASVIKQVEFQISEVKQHLANLERVHALLTSNKEMHELLTLMRRIGL